VILGGEVKPEPFTLIVVPAAAWEGESEVTSIDAEDLVAGKTNAIAKLVRTTRPTSGTRDTLERSEPDAAARRRQQKTPGRSDMADRQHRRGAQCRSSLPRCEAERRRRGAGGTFAS
jgi:hypothetical protein